MCEVAFVLVCDEVLWSVTATVGVVSVACIGEPVPEGFAIPGNLAVSSFSSLSVRTIRIPAYFLRASIVRAAPTHCSVRLRWSLKSPSGASFSVTTVNVRGLGAIETCQSARKRRLNDSVTGVNYCATILYKIRSRGTEPVSAKCVHRFTRGKKRTVTRIR